MTTPHYPEQNIVFMGTALFAVGFLEDLINDGYHVSLVVTTPDKPQGRGHKLKGSPVKEAALRLGLPIAQPEKLSDASFLHTLQEAKPTLALVVAFRMLPKSVWSLPTLGTFNIHASLLPRWRGAAPINHAIRMGDKETGVTLFRLTHDLDEGDIYAQCSTPIEPNETFGELYDRLNQLGRNMLRSKLPALLDGSATATPQDRSTELPYAYKLNKENSRIDWNLPARFVHNFVRSLSPSPGAWTMLHLDEEHEPISIKILSTESLEEESYENTLPGKIILDEKGVIKVACQSGCVKVLTLQAAGKKVMSSRDFLNGTKFTNSRFLE